MDIDIRHIDIYIIHRFRVPIYDIIIYRLYTNIYIYIDIQQNTFTLSICLYILIILL